MKVQRWLGFLAFVTATGVFAASCNGTLSAPLSGPPTETSSLTRPTVRPTRPLGTPTSISGPSFGFTEKVNLDTFSPPGRGRDLLIMNCDNCHPFVCAFRGQRTLGHWQMVEDVHRGRGWGFDIPQDDWDEIFTYLEKNFNDQVPEPTLPSAFQTAGCTQPSIR